MEDCLKILDIRHSLQCSVMILAAVTNTTFAIWYARNKARFQKCFKHWKSNCSVIILQTTLARNTTLKCSNYDIQDFVILKNFSVIIHPSKVKFCKEIMWCPPSLNWVKVNTDGASCGTPWLGVCGGIFRDHEDNHLGSFEYWIEKRFICRDYESHFSNGTCFYSSLE